MFIFSKQSVIEIQQVSDHDSMIIFFLFTDAIRMTFLKECVKGKIINKVWSMPELQIRGSIEDNSKIIFSISQ